MTLAAIAGWVALPRRSSVEAEGTLAGKFNKSRTSVSGTWTMKITFRDPAGVVTDTCDAGIVKWSAKQ